MGIFTNAKDITMHGGTFHTIGEGSNMFDNAINVQATGSRFTLENEHGISDEGNGPRMFRNLKDSKFDRITAVVSDDSEMFKDAENIDVQGSDLEDVGRSYSSPSREGESSSWMPNLITSSPPAIPRPFLVDAESGPSRLGVAAIKREEQVAVGEGKKRQNVAAVEETERPSKRPKAGRNKMKGKARASFSPSPTTGQTSTSLIPPPDTQVGAITDSPDCLNLPNPTTVTQIINTSQATRLRKMQPTAAFTARNFCARKWCAENPNGTTTEFAAHWASIKEIEGEEERYAQEARDAKAAVLTTVESQTPRKTRSKFMGKRP